jgi:hypothetical protein
VQTGIGFGNNVRQVWYFFPKSRIFKHTIVAVLAHFLTMNRIQTRVRLAEIYGVDRQKISVWLREMGITHRASLTPLELELFITKIGTPDQLKRAKELLGVGK